MTETLREAVFWRKSYPWPRSKVQGRLDEATLINRLQAWSRSILKTVYSDRPDSQAVVVHFQAQIKEIARVSFLTFTDQKLTLFVDINQSILELVKDKNKFDSSFETSMKKKTIVSRKHAFDSKNSVIIVGDNNTKYPFDTEEPIYALSDINRKCLKAKGV